MAVVKVKPTSPGQRAVVKVVKVVQVVRLVRSKGVGVYFCTQNPDDVPADVLARTVYDTHNVHHLRLREGLEEAA